MAAKHTGAACTTAGSRGGMQRAGKNGLGWAGRDPGLTAVKLVVGRESVTVCWSEVTHHVPP